MLIVLRHSLILSTTFVSSQKSPNNATVRILFTSSCRMLIVSRRSCLVLGLIEGALRKTHVLVVSYNQTSAPRANLDEVMSYLMNSQRKEWFHVLSYAFEILAQGA